MGEIFEKVAEAASWTHRQKAVLAAVFGTEKYPPNFADTAKDFAVTRERIRQITHKAMRQLFRDDYPDEWYPCDHLPPYR